MVLFRLVHRASFHVKRDPLVFAYPQLIHHFMNQLSADFASLSTCSLDSIDAMEPANTFVFLDLETHDLYQPKITELCLIAVNKHHILDAFEKKSFKPPRVLNKLSLCVYPQVAINPRVVEITGLSNELLQDYAVFNEHAAAAIKSFLNLLPSPITLIAHNGNKFDFPVLQAALQQINQNLPENIRCSDSLPGFKAVFQSWKEKADKENIDKETLLNDGNDDMFLDVDFDRSVNEAEESFSQVLRQNCSQLSWDTSKEATPKRARLNGGQTSDGIICIDLDSDEPSAQGEPVNQSPIRIRRDLFPTTPPVSFSLINVYHKLFGSRPIGHRAENDVIMMLECVLYMGPQILKYFDENFVLFKDVDFPKQS